MEAVWGFVLGLAAMPLYRRLTERKPTDKRVTPLSQEQRQLRHEYQNFLNYTGDEQEAFTPKGD